MPKFLIVPLRIRLVAAKAIQEEGRINKFLFFLEMTSTHDITCLCAHLLAHCTEKMFSLIIIGKHIICFSFFRKRDYIIAFVARCLVAVRKCNSVHLFKDCKAVSLITFPYKKPRFTHDVE